jgi:hypothetical protein
MATSGPEGGPAGLGFLEWVLSAKVEPKHRERAKAALSRRGEGLGSAIRSFDAVPGQQKDVVGHLADAADHLWTHQRVKTQAMWDDAVRWLGTPGNSIKVYEDVATEWDIFWSPNRAARQVMEIYVWRPNAEACPPEAPTKDLYK